VGSRDEEGEPAEAIRVFLNTLPDHSLGGTMVATFDIRAHSQPAGIFNCVAGRIADRLLAKGASLVASPGAFFVKGTGEPLLEGEAERGAVWARDAARNVCLIKALEHLRKSNGYSDIRPAVDCRQSTT
jgi:hypothetical protein